MLTKFKEYVSEHSLFIEKDKLIIGVSGGIDSVVLLDLVSQLKNPIVIAHCNFNLRNEESDQDELFVKKLAEKLNIDFHVKSFNTIEYARKNGISTQMAARELRYTYFESLMEKLGFDLIAIAHNADDAIETTLINLSRGTGIKGLTGIPEKNKNIIRPLLFASRNRIREYQETAGLKYREDSSNQSDKYYRNFIRHHIIPKFEELNPQFRHNLNHTIGILRQTNEIYQKKIRECKEAVIKHKNTQVLINIKELIKFQPIETYLYELISPYGFNINNVKNLISLIDSQPGKQFHTEKYTLIKDREHIIIYTTPVVKKYMLINKNTRKIGEPLPLQFEYSQKTADMKIPTDRNIACVDADKLQFPLKLRKWEKGDRFKPLGMDHYKKLSDYFIDNKLSLAEKEHTWIIETDGRIIWIVGHRIDQRFRITESTKNIYSIMLLDHPIQQS